MKRFLRHPFLNLAQSLHKVIVTSLSNRETGCLSLTDPSDLKSEHNVEKHLRDAILNYVQRQDLNINLYIEGHQAILERKQPEMILFIDPVDGSLNRDLQVGDPSIVITYAQKQSPAFKDILGGYVYGLRSGDTYFSVEGKSYYLPCGNKQPLIISCDHSVSQPRDAILYFNDGYGIKFAEQAFLKAGVLPFLVRHRNAFDNASMEICQMCRGAAHLRVEARSFMKDGVMKGSEHANILAAYGIGKGANLLVTDLDGRFLDNTIIEIDHVQDFICCSNRQLLERTIDSIQNNESLLQQLWPMLINSKQMN